MVIINLRTIRKKTFVGCTTLGSTGGRSHRSINHALQANGELMRIHQGLPARGWYPKQRHTRTTASTEHLDRLHQGSMRAWEMNSNNNTGVKRKPTTLPPNMTPPKFFNKSPREALRRVTSLLINRKGIMDFFDVCFIFYFNTNREYFMCANVLFKYKTLEQVT